MDAKLVVVGGNARPAEIKLNLPVTIGRGRKASLMLPHPHISREHCEIFEVNGQLVVRDLESMNGTFVNNERVRESILAPGAVLTLGPITFRAVYELGQPARVLPSEPLPVQPPLEVEIPADQLLASDRGPRTEKVPGASPADAVDEERATEVSGVDSEEFMRQLREAEQKDGEAEQAG
jgi:pSer/pThr/pTyr-binding forkhead associated (FHA) protein